MSRIGVIVALALAGALAVLAMLVLRPRPTQAPAPLLQFDPARAVALEFRPDAGSPTRVQRQPDGEWTLAPLDRPNEAWPAAATQVRAALRILSRLTPTRTSDESPPRASEIRVVLDDARTLTLRVGANALAGQVLAERTGPDAARGWIGAELVDVIRDVPAWRDVAALPGIGPETSRITLHSASGSLALARVQGRWALREPVAAPADAQAVARLVSRLSSTRIEEFLNAPAPPEAGLDSPQAQATIEGDLRDPNNPAAITTIRRTLSIGRTKDLSSKSAYARIEGVGSSPRDAVISASTLAELTTDPAAYVSRVSLAVPPAEIGAITLTAPSWSRTFQRTLDGWTLSTGTGQPATRIPDQDPVLAQLLDSLAVANCEQAQVAGAPSSGIRAEISSAAGTPIASLTLAAQPSANGQIDRLVVANGPVLRSYSASKAPDLASLIAKP